MKIDELNALIPSEDVRRFVLETGYKFTDWQKAALLYHGKLTVEETFLWLSKLSDNTSDTRLRHQIVEYLTREEQAVAVFKENKDREFMYILKYTEEDCENKVYFFDYSAAYHCGKNQNVPFIIEKYRPYAEFTADNGDYEDYSISDMRYDEKGNAVYFQSSEILYCKDSDKEMNSNFRNMYYSVPYIFEMGDIVRCIGVCGEDNYGVVETSQKEYYEWESRIPSLIYPPAYSDVQVRVAFPCDDGRFCHSHINPLYLEYYNAELNNDKSLDGIRNNLLITVSKLYKGEAVLEDLYYWEAEYKRVMKK